MDNYGKVVARVCVRRGKDAIWLTEAEFIEVYGTMVKEDERVTLVIDYYNIPLPANRVLDIIEDGANSRALDKFPGDWETAVEE